MNFLQNKDANLHFTNVMGLELGDTEFSEDSSIGVECVSPSTLLDDAFVLEWFNQTTGLSCTEQLYTARGS